MVRLYVVYRVDGVSAMTTGNVPVDDPAALRKILDETEGLLLDFDGPICSVFAGFPAATVADQLRQILSDGPINRIPDYIQDTDDPFDVLDFAASLGSNEAHLIEAALRAHEVEAVASAVPTASAHELIHAWFHSGRRLAIVSNNSTAAVESYLHLHGLTPIIDHVSARTGPKLEELKPDPYLINQARKELDLPNSKCTLVGDSLTDLIASNSASVKSIAYANKPGKTESFQVMMPRAIISNMKILRDSAQFP